MQSHTNVVPVQLFAEKLSVMQKSCEARARNAGELWEVVCSKAGMAVFIYNHISKQTMPWAQNIHNASEKTYLILWKQIKKTSQAGPTDPKIITDWQSYCRWLSNGICRGKENCTLLHSVLNNFVWWAVLNTAIVYVADLNLHLLWNCLHFDLCLLFSIDALLTTIAQRIFYVETNSRAQDRRVLIYSFYTVFISVLSWHRHVVKNVNAVNKSCRSFVNKSKTHSLDFCRASAYQGDVVIYKGSLHIVVIKWRWGWRNHHSMLWKHICMPTYSSCSCFTQRFAV